SFQRTENIVPPSNLALISCIFAFERRQEVLIGRQPVKRPFRRKLDAAVPVLLKVSQEVEPILFRERLAAEAPVPLEGSLIKVNDPRPLAKHTVSSQTNLDI